MLFSTVLLLTPAQAFAKTVLVFGDSLSAGYGISYDKAWPVLLKTSLHGEHEIINASVSGETTSGGLLRLPKLLEQHQPDIVILELGANDGLRGSSIKGFQQRLEQLTDLAQQAGSTVIIAGIHLPPNYGPRYSDAFHAVFAKVAEKKDTLLIPFLLDGVALEEGMMQNDGLHPTEKAQSVILENVLQVLEPLLANKEASEEN